MLNILSTFQSVISTVGRWLLAFVVLMFMVLIHETGHYTAGKLLKFKINEFSVGMGPKLWSHKKKNGEIVSLRLLPLGGFCAFEGEDEDAESSQKKSDNTLESDGETKAAVEGSFNAQKPWKRIIVLVSGALFNFISAVLICLILFSAYGETVAKVAFVYDYAPTSTQRQLEVGDVIYKIDGRNVFMLDGISRYMPDDLDEEFSITVIRNGEVVTLNGMKREEFYSTSVESVDGEYFDVESGMRQLAAGDVIYKIESGGETYDICQQGDIVKYREFFDETCVVWVADSSGYYTYEMDSTLFGTNSTSPKIVITETYYEGLGIATVSQTYKFSFGVALSRVFPYCGEVAALVLRTLGGLFTGMIGINDIGGPITTISITSQAVQYGFASVMSLIVLISVNLAVFNLLPVPALDGCRIVFVIIEWIAGKPVNRKVEAWINGIGLILLFGFVILVDLLKLF